MNSRNENKYNLSDIQMAEFVSRGYLIFNSVIDDKTNKDNCLDKNKIRMIQTINEILKK